MKHTFTRITLCVLLFLTSIQLTEASHLMGGNLGYTYGGLQTSGQNAGKYKYTVKLELYRFCGTATPNPSDLPNNMTLGVYREDAANPNADKIKENDYTAPKISQQFINPPSANDSCTFTANACVEQGIYIVDIFVPASSSGYQLIMDRCCRNGNIVNLFDPSNEGGAWYAFIPPTVVINNSPTFAVPPVPFLCINDTNSVLNAAFDPDGDVLIYNFVTPFGGISSPSNSNPNFPNQYPWPIPPVTYDAGYSVTQPFGAGGYAEIDTATGLTRYLSQNQGYYVVAVEIREYRNGFLVGISRLDFQLILITCPVNPAPIANSGGLTTFSVQEGKNICFPIIFHDPNADSLSTTHQGPIFNSTLTNPPATLVDAVGDSVVSAQFCWPTSCLQGSAVPYQFTVTCADNGCPAKTTSQVYTIYVIPFTGTGVVNGPDTLCANDLTGISFSTTGIATSTYNWTITNGVQVTGANTNFISVDFGPTGPYIVSVREVNAIGCEGDLKSKTVNIIPAPVADAGSDLSFCSGGSATIGTTSTPGYSYSWSPATGLSGTTISNPTVTLTNAGGAPVSNKFVVTTSANTCESKDTVEVIVNPLPISNAGNNQFLCSGNSISIGTSFTNGYTYSWSPAAGLNSTTVANPTVTLTNNTGAPVTTIYSVVTTNPYLCTSADNVTVITNILPNVVGVTTPSSVCPGSPATLTASGATTYSWATLTTPGTPIGTSSSITVNPVVPTSYIVTGTNSNNCVFADTIAVGVYQLPAINATQNINNVCPKTQVQLSATGGISYSWATLASPTTVIGTTATINVNPTTTTSYIVIGTDANGCNNADTLTVNVFAAPISNAGNNQSVCSAGTINLGTISTTGYTYVWSPSTGLSSTSISNPTLTLTNSGNTPDTLIYTVTTTSLDGCTAVDSVTVISNPVPTANAGSDGTICSGQSVQIGSTNTAGYAYLWNPSSGLVGPTTSNPTATLTNTTSVFDTVQYVLTTTIFGCTDKDTVDIIVKPNPVAEAGTSQNLCSGDTVVLGAATTSGYTYLWTPSTGLSGTTISDPTAILSGTSTTITTYYVSTQWNGCITNDSVTLTMNPLPVVAATTNPSAICAGTNATLTGSGAATYNWATLANPGVSIGTTNPLTVNPTASTTYILTGTSAAQCVSTDTISLQVNPLPSVSASAPNDSICFGDSIVLSGNGAVNYTWEILGGASLGSGSSVQVAPTAATSYVVTGTDAIGCENKDTISITVNPAPTLSAANGTLSVCPDVVGIPYWVINPNSNSNYIWTISGGTVASGQGKDTVFVDWGAAGTGTVSVIEETDLGCPSEPVVLTVSINALLTPIAPTGTATICANDGLGLVYTAFSTPGSTYTWFISGGTIVSGGNTNTVTVNWNIAGPAIGYIWYQEQSITPTTVCLGISDTMMIQINPAPTTSAVTGINSICVFDSTTLSVANTSGSTYQWTATNGTISSGNGTNTITAGWNVDGTFAASVVETNSFGCVGDPVSYNVTVNPLPVASAGNNVGICINQSTTQLNASGGVSYSWAPATGLSATNIANPTANPSTSTTYTVTVTNANGCSNTSSVTVSVNALPIATTSANPTAVCIGSSTQLQAGGGTGYVWSASADLSNTSIANPVATPTATATYTVTVTDANSCSSSTSITVAVNPLPTITASNDVLICDNASVTISATGGVSYAWSPATGLSSTSVANPTATLTSPVTYTVVGTDANGCTNSDQILVSINPKPIAAFNSDSTFASCNGIQVDFKNESTFSDSYFWSFGDGTTSTLDNPTHNFPFASTNNVTLIAGNNGICFDTLVQAVALNPLASYLENVPNVFTPNGDNINDCFSFSGLGDFAACTSIKIFDRWGTLTYSSSDIGACWDGKKGGKEVPIGTYFFIIDVSGMQLKGTVSLLR